MHSAITSRIKTANLFLPTSTTYALDLAVKCWLRKTRVLNKSLRNVATTTPLFLTGNSRKNRE
jgi:hypothetical protein